MRTLMLISGLMVAATAGTAFGADQKVPSQHKTIQDAVDAAGPGDRILVSRGVYTENVVATVDRLQFIGKRAVWDGTIGNVRGDCLTATGDKILVQGFKFRNGNRQVLITGDDATVQKCVFRGSNNWATDIDGNDATVQKNRYHGAEDGARIDGDDATVQKNRFQQTDCSAVEIDGDRANVEKNTMLTTWDDDCINVTGNDTRIVKNRMSNDYEDMIVTSGTGVLIQGNKMQHGADSGIIHTGDNCTIDRNTITAIDGVSVDVTGDNIRITGNRVNVVFDDNAFEVDSRTAAGGGLIERNTATDVTDTGFQLNVDNVTIRSNVALRCGVDGDDGFEINGDANTINGNRAIDSVSNGFHIIGTGNKVSDCSALNSVVDGFRVQGADNEFTRVTAKASDGEGFDNRGTNTTVRSSTFLGNRIDIANGGGATFNGGLNSNKFQSGGETTAPEID